MRYRQLFFYLPLAFIFYCLATWAEQTLQVQIHRSLGSGDLSSMAGFFLLGAFGLFSLLKPVITFLWILKLIETKLDFNLGEKFSFLVREQLRALGWISLGLLLFIIPGLVWLVRYSLVPFVVLLDPNYSLGRADALKTSWEWSNGKGTQIFIVLGLWLIALPGLILSFEPFNLFNEHPFHAVLLTSFDFLFFYMVCWYFWNLSSKRMKEL